MLNPTPKISKKYGIVVVIGMIVFLLWGIHTSNRRVELKREDIRQTIKLLIIGVDIEIERLLTEGYTEDSEEVQNMREHLVTATESYHQADINLVHRKKENIMVHVMAGIAVLAFYVLKRIRY